LLGHLLEKSSIPKTLNEGFLGKKRKKKKRVWILGGDFVFLVFLLFGFGLQYLSERKWGERTAPSRERRGKPLTYMNQAIKTALR